MNEFDDSPNADLMAIAGEVFHGHVDARDDNGQYSGTGFDGQRFDAALTAYPYGLRSHAPRNTGLILTHSKACLLVLSQEGKLPDGVSEPLSGEVVLYNSQGARVHLDEDGDIRVVQKSGREVLLGTAASDYVALAGFVDTRIAVVASKHDGHKHAGVTTGGGTSGPPDLVVGAQASVRATEVKAT